ncbi:hypothetical protein [Paenibacillus validus]|uniref:Uncharacterized protein n=1 Tax=Paenibacillus validus TaxID=44253 RepID=A0A7X3CRA2_9BACL|nr:hypothetical protein [Paenibacillus validus]MUG69521.1 hypothetical protein [Paenibacillus validus]
MSACREPVEGANRRRREANSSWSQMANEGVRQLEVSGSRTFVTGSSAPR